MSTTPGAYGIPMSFLEHLSMSLFDVDVGAGADCDRIDMVPSATTMMPVLARAKQQQCTWPLMLDQGHAADELFGPAAAALDDDECLVPDVPVVPDIDPAAETLQWRRPSVAHVVLAISEVAAASPGADQPGSIWLLEDEDLDHVPSGDKESCESFASMVVPSSPEPTSSASRGAKSRTFSTSSTSSVSSTFSTSTASSGRSTPLCPAGRARRKSKNRCPVPDGWCDSLLDMTTKELNKFFKSKNLSGDKIAELKSCRRRIKNRSYTRDSRSRKYARETGFQ